MDDFSKKLVFHPQANPQRPRYGCIEGCGVTNCSGDISLANNINSFISAFGYTDEVRKTGMFIDEFIFDEYKKNNAKQSPNVLQEKIIEYLGSHCDKFKRYYKL